MNGKLLLNSFQQFLGLACSQCVAYTGMGSNYYGQAMNMGQQFQQQGQQLLNQGQQLSRQFAGKCIWLLNLSKECFHLTFFSKKKLDDLFHVRNFLCNLHEYQWKNAGVTQATVARDLQILVFYQHPAWFIMPINLLLCNNSCSEGDFSMTLLAQWTIAKLIWLFYRVA